MLRRVLTPVFSSGGGNIKLISLNSSSLDVTLLHSEHVTVLWSPDSSTREHRDKEVST